MTRRGQRGIWQRRYSEHTIRDERDFAAYMDYTHFNRVPTLPSRSPGQARGGEDWGGGTADWPHSSFRRCVASGLYPAGWTGGNAEPQATGERR